MTVSTPVVNAVIAPLLVFSYLGYMFKKDALVLFSKYYIYLYMS